MVNGRPRDRWEDNIRMNLEEIGIKLDFQENNLNPDRDVNYGSPDHQPDALNH